MSEQEVESINQELAQAFSYERTLEMPDRLRALPPLPPSLLGYMEFHR